MTVDTLKIKQKTCKVCGCKFVPRRPMQPVCEEFACKVAFADRVAAKAKAKREKIERAQDRAKREAMKTRSDWMREAQIAFNAYIRERDKDKPCICCGEPLLASAVGGGFDCGHYRSVGSAPHLRFDERNAHGQRKQCNRYGAGRAVDYRLGLIRRLGFAVVDSLESDQVERKWTIDDLKAIKDEYIAKLKALKSARGNE